MLRRLLAALLAVLGVAAIVLAVMSATTWRESDELTATLPEDPTTPVLLTEPGVLDMAGDEVTVTLTADEGEDIWLMIAPTDQVVQWVGDAARTTVTGFDTRTELAARTEGTEESVPHPSGSDLFRGGEEGTGELTVEWTDEPGRWSVFAVVDGTADAPTLTLTWPREVATPYLVPGLVTGGVLLLVALALLLWPTRRRAEEGVLADGTTTAGSVGIDDDAAASRTAGSVEIDDVAAASRTETGAYGSAPAAGAPTTDPYARGYVAAGPASEDGGTADRAGDGAAADASVDRAPDDDTGSMPAAEEVDVSPEAVDAALPADMAALAERERSGEKLRRYERRVLADARRETHDDLRAGGDAQVREDLRSAGASRGAGILPYSPRADETRAGGAPADDATHTAGAVHEADPVVADAQAAQADGRPLSRRERRALERRARLGTETESPERPAGAASVDGAPETTSAPSSATDDEWRDLWGFGPRDADDPEVKR